MVGNGGCFCRKICYNSVILFEGEPDLKLSRLVFPPDGASRGTLRAHRAYLAVLLTLLGVGIGFLGLWLTACADAALPQAELYRSYLDHPLLLALNLFPPLLLAWLGYFLSGRCWCGVLLSGLFGVGLPLINYYKVMLRGDPMRASDILLLRTAGGIMSQYEFERTAEVNMAVALLGAMLAFAVLLMPRGDKRWRARALGAAACVLLGVGASLGAYTDEAVYERTANDSLINIWSDNEVYLSRGFALSFLHSVPELFPEKPEGYDARAAQTLLESFPDEDIPEGEKVAVMGVMLEAFCDLTDFDALAGFDTVQEVYAPWHALEEQSLSGRLLTNIFAGGTVDTEWGFLTGASEHDEYCGATGSYVRYFTAQGYAAHYAHPGYSWFYDRERVNDYLGFDRSVFTENGFGELVDPYVAMWHSDQQLADYLLADLDAADGSPLFSFAVSYQNHGPYAETESTVPYVSPEASGWSQESCNILNNYLFGVNETVREYVRLTQELDARDTPVVLVLFGDHKPWMGNGGSVYEEMGIDFDTSTLAGFRNYYATPYLIWANRAAKEVLGADFTGQLHGITNRKALEEKTHELVDALYAKKEAEISGAGIDMREVERVVLLKAVDSHWMDHIDAMDQLRQGIGLQALGQKDPVVAYRNMGFDMFDEMVLGIREQTVRNIFHVTVRMAPQQREQLAKPVEVAGDDKQKPKRTDKKPGRNDPCPCGSGLKYKNCCGRN